MTEQDALEFMNSISEQCRAAGAWFFPTPEYKPDLRGIKIEISIKVDPRLKKGETGKNWQKT